MLCYTELQSAVSRSCSESRTMQRGSFCRCRNEACPSCYFRSLTGYQRTAHQVQGDCTRVQVRSTLTPAYLYRHIWSHEHAQELRSSTTPMLFEPFAKADFAKCAFRCSAPGVWNSLPMTMMRTGPYRIGLSAVLWISIPAAASIVAPQRRRRRSL